jgi:hypothetical protein
MTAWSAKKIKKGNSKLLVKLLVILAKIKLIGAPPGTANHKI